MDKVQFWKNFKLGEELDISGRLVYNGLKIFHEIYNLNGEKDIFEFLYHISVGIERLLKIAVVMVEHSELDDQKKFEESLITHNHQDLLKRVKETDTPLNFSKCHNRLLALLSDFYKKSRYGCYALSIAVAENWETVEF